MTSFLVTLGSGESSLPIWIAPKITFPVKEDEFNLGIGAVYANAFGGDGTGDGVGFLYGVSTFGSKDQNLSLGIGWGYGLGEGLSDTPTLSLSFMSRGKPKWDFLTENYFIGVGSDKALILSGGARYIGNKLGIDFGGFTFLYLGGGQDIFPVLPWLSISVPFGGKK